MIRTDNRIFRITTIESNLVDVDRHLAKACFGQHKKYKEQYGCKKSFHAFKLLEFSTNSTLAGKTAYTIIGTYDLPSSGLQKLMEIGTIIGDKVYSLQYIADAPKYSEYLPAVQNMIHSLAINSPGGTSTRLLPGNGLSNFLTAHV